MPTWEAIYRRFVRLAMVLNWPAIQLVGVTTVSDDGGRRLVMYAMRSR
jgi:hypothetical protein